MSHVFARSCAAIAAALLLISLSVERGHAQAPPCPCSLFAPSAVPVNPAVTDGVPIETGVKFRSDMDGYVTAIRSTGDSTARTWGTRSPVGALLAEATFVKLAASTAGSRARVSGAHRGKHDLRRVVLRRRATFA
jgi:hypothetical protein